MARKRARLECAIDGRQDELRQRIARAIPRSSVLRVATYSIDTQAARWLADLISGRPITARILVDESACAPEAAEACDTLPNATVRVHSLRSQGGVLHAKMWLLENKRQYLAAVGSANLSQPALSANQEATIVVSGRAGDVTHSRLSDWFDALWADEARTEAWSSELGDRIRQRSTLRRGPDDTGLPLLEAWHPYVVGAVLGGGGIPDEDGVVYVEYRGRSEVRAPSGERVDQAGLLRRDVSALAGLVDGYRGQAPFSAETVEAGTGRWRIVYASEDQKAIEQLAEVVSDHETRVRLLESLLSASPDTIRLFLRGLADARANVSEGTSADVLYYFGTSPGLAQVGRELVALCRLFQEGLGIPIDWMEWPQQRKQQREFQFRIRAADFLSIGFDLAYRQNWLLQKAAKYPARRDSLCPRDADDGFVPYCAEAGCRNASEGLANAGYEQ